MRMTKRTKVRRKRGKNLKLLSSTAKTGGSHSLENVDCALLVLVKLCSLAVNRN